MIRKYSFILDIQFLKAIFTDNEEGKHELNLQSLILEFCMILPLFFLSFFTFTSLLPSGNNDGSHSADDFLHCRHRWHRGLDGTKKTERAGWGCRLKLIAIILLQNSEQVHHDLPRVLFRRRESVQWRVLKKTRSVLLNSLSWAELQCRMSLTWFSSLRGTESPPEYKNGLAAVPVSHSLQHWIGAIIYGMLGFEATVSTPLILTLHLKSFRLVPVPYMIVTVNLFFNRDSI